jgi:peptidyl-prolyl cis-trans isomerase C
MQSVHTQPTPTKPMQDRLEHSENAPEFASGRKVLRQIRGGTIDVNAATGRGQPAQFRLFWLLERNQSPPEIIMSSTFRLPALTRGFAALLMLTAASGAFAQEDKVLATVNGEPITESDITLAESNLDQQFARLPEEQRRAAALSALIEIKLLAGEAVKSGIENDPQFKKELEFLRLRALHTSFVDKQVAGAVTDADVRARYDQEIANTPPANEVHARHILVETKEEAEAIIKELDAGGDFEAIAKEKSKDGAAANGGDLGYFGPGQMVPEFEKAAQALEVGAYTKEPVQTQFGFHVIKVEDKRAQQPPAFEQVQGQIRSMLLREKYFETVDKIRKAAKVEVDDPALKQALDAMDGDDKPAEGEKPAQ